MHSLPAGGKQRLQPVHIDDIGEAINRWLQDDNAHHKTVAAVGAEATDMRGMFNSYRQQLQHSPALHIHIPAFIMQLSAMLGDAIPSSPLCTDTLTMLNAGNTADSTAFAILTGRLPKSYKNFIQS